MLRSDALIAWGTHKSESETERTMDLKVEKSGEEMLASNCTLHLTLKL